MPSKTRTKNSNNKTFISSANSIALREYQKNAGNYPPLQHDRIVSLSREFILGRNNEISLEEYVLFVTLTGSWDEKAFEALSDEVMNAIRIETMLRKRINDDHVTEELIELFERTNASKRLHDDDWRKTNIQRIIELGFIPKSFVVIDNIDNDAAINDKNERAEITLLFDDTPKDVADEWSRRVARMGTSLSGFRSSLAEVKTAYDDINGSMSSIENGKHALATIILHNMQLAMSRISKMMVTNPRAKKLDVSDLIGAANVGLVLGARQYNPEMGRKFSTYASFHIDAQLHDLVNGERTPGGIMGPSLHEQKQLDSVISVKTSFMKLYEREPSLYEIRSLTGLRIPTIENRLSTPKIKTKDIYDKVDNNNNSNDNTRSYADIMSSDSDTIDETISNEQYEELSGILFSEIKKLPDDERSVIEACCDILDNGDIGTISRIVSRRTGMTSKDVRECYYNAVTKLRSRLELLGWDKDKVMSLSIMTGNT